MLLSFGEISFLQVDGFFAVVGHGAEMPDDDDDDDDEYTGGLTRRVKKRKPASKNGNKLKSKTKQEKKRLLFACVSASDCVVIVAGPQKTRSDVIAARECR